ncbi:MAG: NAD(P)-binding protein [Acidobacteria bacterium]|nr:NAD(P)-binding protein [Acidobacteriota bacterium]
MPTGADPHKPIHVLGAGLSGLSAAIVLAQAGREVHVHELRADSGARFAGDFQAIENWSHPVDFLDEMRGWGLDPGTFQTTPFRQMDLVLPRGEIVTARTPGIAFRLVVRGTRPGTLDQGLKRQAETEGVHLHYRVRRDRELCDIVATGPKTASGLVCGELFETSHPDHVAFQLDDRLAPGAYTYLIVVDGTGLIATVLLRRQRDAERFLNETLAWYHAHYPALDRRPLHRMRGVGGFALNPRHVVDGRCYVGEAAGFQDGLWGFGIRYAITSGVLAARALLGELDYEQAVRETLRPFQAASLTNRWLLNHLGRWGFEGLARLWIRSQRLGGDGLRFLSRLYQPSWLHSLIEKTAAHHMLEKHPAADGGLEMRSLTLAPAKPRDKWEPSEPAQAIARQHAATRVARRPQAG